MLTEFGRDSHRHDLKNGVDIMTGGYRGMYVMTCPVVESLDEEGFGRSPTDPAAGVMAR